MDDEKYYKLAYDLYNSAAELLEKLVGMRKYRKMTQQQLAEEMDVSQSYISQIENGRVSMLDLVTSYALEVGARIEYTVEPAETDSVRFTVPSESSSWHDEPSSTVTESPSWAEPQQEKNNEPSFRFSYHPQSALSECVSY